MPRQQKGARIHRVNTRPIIDKRPHRACQAVGAAAHLLEFDSILVPSVRWPTKNLVVFLDYVPDWESDLVVGEANPVNWASWREHDDVKRILETKPANILHLT